MSTWSQSSNVAQQSSMFISTSSSTLCYRGSVNLIYQLNEFLKALQIPQRFTEHYLHTYLNLFMTLNTYANMPTYLEPFCINYTNSKLILHPHSHTCTITIELQHVEKQKQ